MNGGKAKKIRKMLIGGNKQLLDALVKRYGESVLEGTFKSNYRKAKKIYKDLQAGRPL
jgi:hypothetical protein